MKPDEGPEGDGAAEASGSNETARPRRRRRSRPARKPAKTGDESVEASAAPIDGEASGDESPDSPGPPEGDAGARPSRRGRTRRRKAAPRAAPEAAEATGEDGEKTAAPEGKKKRGRRRTTRKKKKPTPSVEAAEPTAEAAEAAPKKARGRRRPSRKSESEASAEAPPEDGTAFEAAEDDAEEVAGPAEAKPVEKVLLVNASDGEEVRIALLEDGQVEELYIEAAEERTATGNVYRGRVQNVEKAIGAAFVELGRSLTGFLHVSDLPDREPGMTIADLLEPGQEIVVQITRDGVGKKGPALSGRISLAGRYLVLLANTPRSGVSRRIARGRLRDKARKLLGQLELPEGMGLIIRTAGEGGGHADLRRDLDHLLAEWETLQERAAKPGAPGLLRAESDLAERSVRDIMPTDVSRIVVDREGVAARVRTLLGAWYGTEDEAADGDDPQGRGIPEVIVHEDRMPLLHAYEAEPQLEEAFRRTLRLPSGGSVVIDPTEALVSIDVNSGRSTEEEDPDATALQTNLEAVEVVARQLRLRDLGGLVVVDLIDMRDRRNARAVEKAFRKALARDRARIRLGRIGPFGCVTLSRQRIRQALSRVTHEDCPNCGGTGRRRHPAGLGLRVLREMQARVARARGRGGLEVRVPKSVSDWIQRHRGRALAELDKACSGPVRLEADDRLAVDGWAMKGLPPSGRGRKA